MATEDIPTRITTYDKFNVDFSASKNIGVSTAGAFCSQADIATETTADDGTKTTTTTTTTGKLLCLGYASTISSTFILYSTVKDFEGLYDSRNLLKDANGYYYLQGNDVKQYTDDKTYEVDTTNMEANKVYLFKLSTTGGQTN